MTNPSSDVPPSAPSPAPAARTTTVPAKGASKTALLLSFAAGAAFSWLIINHFGDNDQPAEPEASAPRSSVMAAPSPAASVVPTPAVAPHAASAAPHAGVNVKPHAAATAAH